MTFWKIYQVFLTSFHTFLRGETNARFWSLLSSWNVMWEARQKGSRWERLRSCLRLQAYERSRSTNDFQYLEEGSGLVREPELCYFWVNMHIKQDYKQPCIEIARIFFSYKKQVFDGRIIWLQNWVFYMPIRTFWAFPFISSKRSERSFFSEYICSPPKIGNKSTFELWNSWWLKLSIFTL